METKEYFDRLLMNFPEYDEYHDRMGPFFNMDRLADYLIGKVLINEWDTVKRMMNFLEEWMPEMDEVLLNAFNVSFCENILLNLKISSSEREKIIRLMPKEVLVIYKDYEQHWKNLTGN